MPRKLSRTFGTAILLANVAMAGCHCCRSWCSPSCFSACPPMMASGPAPGCQCANDAQKMPFAAETPHSDTRMYAKMPNGEVVVLDGSAQSGKQPQKSPSGALIGKNATQPMPKGPAVIETTKGETPAFPRGAASVQRKAFADITAHSSFGHAPDYKWISGEVHQVNGEWRLRYASVDEVDAYGGAVTLVGAQQIMDLRDGQQFKLQGRLVPSSADAATFHIESVESISNHR